MEPALQSHPFTRRVVQAMRKLYPEELADRAWDNVGLLQENMASDSVPSRVMLTNDLTLAVAEEAIRKQASVIVSYHPFIFRGLKSVTLGDPHQRIVLRLAQHNIAVYSPHTAVDAAPGGINDWLADMLSTVPDLPPIQSRTVAQPIRAGTLSGGFSPATTGYGRVISLTRPAPLAPIVRAYATALGMQHVMVARPRQRQRHRHDDDGEDAEPRIRTIAVCAGSGYDVLKDVAADADLIVTGEMSHHNALRLTMLGKSVLTVFHSNSERGFLKAVLKGQLEEELRKDGGSDEAVEVLVSEEDADPFEIWAVGKN
ncbi:hypothetical protein VTK26DRAFT_2685 [Humicola hyalothermophila]